MVGQGNLEKEKSGDLKINGFGSLQKNFLLLFMGKVCSFYRDGPVVVTLKGKNLLPGEQILSFKSTLYSK